MTINAPPTPPLEDSELPEAPPVEITATELATEPPVTAADPAPPTEAPIVTDEQPQAEALPPQAPDNTYYHNVFPTLVSLAAENNYKTLISRAELFDVDVCLHLDRYSGL